MKPVLAAPADPTPRPTDTARRLSEALHALACVAEREGNLPLAVKISQAADEAAPFVPYTDDEIRQMRCARRAGAR